MRVLYLFLLVVAVGSGILAGWSDALHWPNEIEKALIVQAAITGGFMLLLLPALSE